MKTYKRALFVMLAIFFVHHTSGQINAADSTVQAITYWKKGEVHNYTITEEKIKMNGSDTTFRETNTNEIEVTVLDQTDTSYIIKWNYKAGTSDTKDTLTLKMMQATQLTDVIFRTNETGVFKEIINWEELRDEMVRMIGIISADYADNPGTMKAFEEVVRIFSTRQAIEAIAFKDIQQFHMFYGVKYQMGEPLEAQIKLANVLGPEPFDADLFVALEGIYEEDELYVLSALQVVDPAELKDAVVGYLNSVAKEVEGASANPEEISGLINETQTVSSIHDSGWLLYSEQTTMVVLGEIAEMNRRVIEFQEDDEEG